MDEVSLVAETYLVQVLASKVLTSLRMYRFNLEDSSVLLICRVGRVMPKVVSRQFNHSTTQVLR